MISTNVYELLVGCFKNVTQYFKVKILEVNSGGTLRQNVQPYQHFSFDIQHLTFDIQHLTLVTSFAAIMSKRLRVTLVSSIALMG